MDMFITCFADIMSGFGVAKRARSETPSSSSASASAPASAASAASTPMLSAEQRSVLQWLMEEQQHNPGGAWQSLSALVDLRALQAAGFSFLVPPPPTQPAPQPQPQPQPQPSPPSSSPSDSASSTPIAQSAPPSSHSASSSRFYGRSHTPFAAPPMKYSPSPPSLVSASDSPRTQQMQEQPGAKYSPPKMEPMSVAPDFHHKDSFTFARPPASLYNSSHPLPATRRAIDFVRDLQSSFDPRTRQQADFALVAHELTVSPAPDPRFALQIISESRCSSVVSFPRSY